MKNLILIAALASSVASAAFAQESDAGVSTGTTGGAESTSGAGNNNMGGDDGASNTTNAPNAPFLGNRDRIGAFYTDNTMTSMRSGDEFALSYQALSEEDRARIATDCQSPAGFERFCDAFVAQGTTAQ